MLANGASLIFFQLISMPRLVSRTMRRRNTRHAVAGPGFGQVEAEPLGLQVRDPCRDPVERRLAVNEVAGVHVGHGCLCSHVAMIAPDATDWRSTGGTVYIARQAR